jgi:cyanate lyase
MNKAERKPLADPLGPSMLDLNGNACTKKLRSLLVQRRVKGQLTQGELATRLGKVQSYIAKIEIGDRSLHIADLIQICRALNASPVRLLKEAIEKGYTI